MAVWTTDDAKNHVRLAIEIRAAIAEEQHACARAIAAAMETEREACAVLAEHGGPDAPWNGRDQEELDNLEFGARRIARAIRARGTQ